jgi:hypothetical protein
MNETKKYLVLGGLAAGAFLGIAALFHLLAPPKIWKFEAISSDLPVERVAAENMTCRTSGCKFTDFGLMTMNGNAFQVKRVDTPDRFDIEIEWFSASTNPIKLKFARANYYSNQDRDDDFWEKVIAEASDLNGSNSGKITINGTTLDGEMIYWGNVQVTDWDFVCPSSCLAIYRTREHGQRAWMVGGLLAMPPFKQHRITRSFTPVPPGS